MKALNNIIRAFTPETILRVRENGHIDVDVEGETFRLSEEDLEIVSTPKEGLAVATEGQLSVALDTEISEELRNEGIARELVNRIQNLRKEEGFNVTDRIHLTMELPDELREAVQKLEFYIREETLAEKIEYGKNHRADKKEINIAPFLFYLSVEKAKG
jgi:isoleucyl-tRNA synthetase